MTDLLILPIKLAITIALCFFISNCGIPIETSKGTFTIDNLSKEERRRNHQDPSRMAEELEHDRRAEISKDIRKQDIKENSAREKRLNEIIDKQLHHQQGKNHQPSNSQ